MLSATAYTVHTSAGIAVCVGDPTGDPHKATECRDHLKQYNTIHTKKLISRFHHNDSLYSSNRICISHALGAMTGKGADGRKLL